MKYSFSKVVKHCGIEETFSVSEAHSFDEAVKEVEKGIRNRLLDLELSKPPTKVSATLNGEKEVAKTGKNETGRN